MGELKTDEEGERRRSVLPSLSCLPAVAPTLGTPQEPQSVTPQASHPSGMKEGSFLRTYYVQGTVPSISA